MLVSIGFSIRAVAERTGISQHTIRAWERRYDVLRPTRTDTNRRVYEEQDVERLTLLARAVAAGHSIGLIAKLDDEQLRSMAEPNSGLVGASAADHLESCVRAVRELNADALAAELRRASSSLGVDGYLEDVVIPLLKLVGSEWQLDETGIAREHLASAVLRSHLEELRRAFPAGAGAPRIIVTTPVGEHHEFGAMMAAVIAARDGWRVYYLGPNLPASEIAASARRVGASAVALSVVHPENAIAVGKDIVELSTLLEGRRLLIGGSDLQALHEYIAASNASELSGLKELRAELSAIRAGSLSRN
jgi:DNA-binding transcriptional MerR regulator